MFNIGKIYLYDLKTNVTYIGEDSNYYVFKSEVTTYRISKYNTQSIRKPFKFISL